MVPKRIKVFICTYNDDPMLHRCLDSLVTSDIVNHNYSIQVLNNYGRMTLSEPYVTYNISIINNEARPDFSRGHLSRSWNQAIIHGFKDLSDPDCDFVVAVQNDIVFSPTWCKSLLKYHEKYDFIQVGLGDDFQSFTPESVRKVGLYDERFCNIGGQHYDYYFRQIIFNRDKSSINDFYHYTVHNPIYSRDISPGYDKTKPQGGRNRKYMLGYTGLNDIIEHQVCGYLRGNTHHLKSMEYHVIASEFLCSKWYVPHSGFLNKNPYRLEEVGNATGLWFSFAPFEDYDTEDFDDRLWEVVGCINPQPVFYPYFECGIRNKEEIGYEDVDLTGEYDLK